MDIIPLFVENYDDSDFEALDLLLKVFDESDKQVE